MTRLPKISGLYYYNLVLSLGGISLPLDDVNQIDCYSILTCLFLLKNHVNRDCLQRATFISWEIPKASLISLCFLDGYFRFIIDILFLVYDDLIHDWVCWCFHRCVDMHFRVLNY